MNIFSIDLQSVATGKKCGDRSPAYISIIGEDNSTIYETFIKPDHPVISTIEPYTGIKQSDLDDAPTMAEVTTKVKAYFGEHPTVVGQDSSKYFGEKLMVAFGLKMEIDYAYVSLSEWFKYNHGPGKKFPYQYFTLEIELKALLGKELSKELGARGKACIELYNAYKEVKS
ncbi:unnamed protein product [Owenia fusiformis]|uniref:Uncharacterized protein n=1 Tax=Owenia fusiformis TaxID=6347 RepID=A0A8J1UCK6_OWEFU|nr:unnamed protein product [Owenia fusiformis]